MCELSYIKKLKTMSTHPGSRTDMIQQLLYVLHTHNTYTAEHNHRVGEVAYCLAQAMGLDFNEIIKIKEAGYLHDIGKLFIPLSSICKTEALSEVEYQEMKNHPQFGAKIISQFDYLDDLLAGVLYHHERFDGLGYPFGLVGENIPLSARIIAVADTFDAMTSHRSYRKALSLKDTLDELAQVAGTQLDPTVVDIALSIDLSPFMDL